MPVNVAHLSLEIPGNLFLDAGSNSQSTCLSLGKFSLYKHLATFSLHLSKIFCESLSLLLWEPSPTFLIIFSSSHFPALFDKKDYSTDLNQSIV